MGRRYDPHVDLDALVAAKLGELGVLQDMEELGLQGRLPASCRRGHAARLGASRKERKRAEHAEHEGRRPLRRTYIIVYV